MTNFHITELTGDRYLVEGTDVRHRHGQVILDGAEYNQHIRSLDTQDALEDFDAAVTQFFAPLVEAAEKAEKATKLELDSLEYIVESEPVEAVEGKAGVLRQLQHDTVLLRAVQEAPERLRWVGPTYTELVLVKAGPLTDPDFAPLSTVVDEPIDHSEGFEQPTFEDFDN